MPRFPPERLDVTCYPTTVGIPVLYGDLDPNRHINNVSMGRFYEHARVLATSAIPRTRITVFVARVAIDYVSEGRFGHPLTIGTRLASVGTSSLTLEQCAWQQGRVVSLCESVLVHVVDGRPTPLPPETVSGLAGEPENG